MTIFFIRQKYFKKNFGFLYKYSPNFVYKRLKLNAHKIK